MTALCPHLKTCSHINTASSCFVLSLCRCSAQATWDCKHGPSRCLCPYSTDCVHAHKQTRIRIGGQKQLHCELVSTYTHISHFGAVIYSLFIMLLHCWGCAILYYLGAIMDNLIICLQQYIWCSHSLQYCPSCLMHFINFIVLSFIIVYSYSGVLHFMSSSFSLASQLCSKHSFVVLCTAKIKCQIKFQSNMCILSSTEVMNCALSEKKRLVIRQDVFVGQAIQKLWRQFVPADDKQPYGGTKWKCKRSPKKRFVTTEATIFCTDTSPERLALPTVTTKHYHG